MRRILFALTAMALISGTHLARADSYSYAVVEVLDKITTHKQKIALPLSRPLNVGTIRVVAQTCQKSPPTEQPQTAAFLQIYDTKDERGGKKPIFSGWLFHEHPSLSSLEHAIYDLILVDCSNAPII